jgi:uncharacterized membrane protein YphA (DoxX/SURF4 family)
VAQALTAPILLAAAVLCIAGVAKLRSPDTATRAFEALGLPARPALVRALAIVELAIGIWCAIDRSGPAALALACLYAAFAAAAGLLSRRHSSCGCFGAEELPASLWQAVLSAAFGAVALAGAVAGAHGLQWVLDRPAFEAATILIGTAGAAYATVLAYTLLPQAWTSWSAP